ncbi:hypothetical protein PPL_03898 [Heterostelium album PN500]|uniref:Uncharacterized protein n=1 Tax=Heterostelium pallidum (strain ATCC 26659 / Pp 5 / PN500) TaxID=670386 RepID=D3B5G0_HETP5|nr:hypothetical protein PPL_03898 [Heterostelium album PN500]EFA83108.1 hypothetical protein PPL_03898 [Heterostelium album PN500]|eukprot:XP_020435225.1 hypothetical protein PPL_03898 [Heterostelium album PN500]
MLLKNMSQQQQQFQPKNLKNRNLRIGLVITGFIALAFSYPIYFVVSHQKQKRDPNDAYSRNASIRGTFLNAGSRVCKLIIINNDSVDIGSDKSYIGNIRKENNNNNNNES